VITYTIRVTNFSQDHVSQVRVTDSLAPGLHLAGPVQLEAANPAGAIVAQSSSDLPELVRELSITVGRSITLSVPVLIETDVAVETTIHITATVTSAELTGPFTDSVSIKVSDVELGLHKGVSQAHPTTQEVITYTIVVSNSGTGTATEVTVLDLLPPELAFEGPVSVHPFDLGAVLAVSGADLPLLARELTISGGSQVTLTLPVRVQEGVLHNTTLTNTASLTSTTTQVPISDQVLITIDTFVYHTYLPVIQKNLNR
jgi:uncharacterized repeat protein (TIGR01451 family)